MMYYVRPSWISWVAALGSFIAAHGALADDTPLERGQFLVTDNCGACHAVGRDDASAHNDAPAFRTLSGKYPVEHLAEALAEGIMSGHPDMPELSFEPDEIDSIIAYLESVQSH